MQSLPADLNIPERFYEQIVREASARPTIQRVILFGSRARGDALKRADVDLAIEAPALDRKAWGILHWELTEEADTLLEVDVVRLEDAELRLRDRILRDGRVIYDRGSRTRQP